MIEQLNNIGHLHYVSRFTMLLIKTYLSEAKFKMKSSDTYEMA